MYIKEALDFDARLAGLAGWIRNRPVVFDKLLLRKNKPTKPVIFRMRIAVLITPSARADKETHT